MKILLLGATGSIGTTACRCVRRLGERFSLAGVSTNHRVAELARIADEFGVADACVADPGAAREHGAALSGVRRVRSGPDGLLDLVETVDFDILLNALVGYAGLAPTMAALRRGKRVALANKESLVVGGDCITALLRQGRGELVPVDSEHSAILQCITGERHESVESIILTASGGPFRELPADRFSSITPAQALSHPTWSMGSKITIDCATLMNKGFEVVEAHHLFGLSYDHLRVWIHPQSIVHSMVEFHDGAIMAQLGVPDMELPIQFALTYPQRLSMPGKRLDLADVGALTFFRPDLDRFPCLRLCLEAGSAGGTAPAVVNAANEVAVERFLAGALPFDKIAALIDDALQQHAVRPADSLEIIAETDIRTREFALSRAGRYAI